MRHRYKYVGRGLSGQCRMVGYQAYNLVWLETEHEFRAHSFGVTEQIACHAFRKNRYVAIVINLRFVEVAAVDKSVVEYFPEVFVNFSCRGSHRLFGGAFRFGIPGIDIHS